MMIHPLSRLFVLFLLTIYPLFIISCDKTPGPEEQIENTLELLNLPANQWIKYHHDDWWKKGHAGLTYDSKRGGLLIFGSDTHAEALSEEPDRCIKLTPPILIVLSEICGEC